MEIILRLLIFSEPLKETLFGNFGQSLHVHLYEKLLNFHESWHMVLWIIITTIWQKEFMRAWIWDLRNWYKWENWYTLKIENDFINHHRCQLVLLIQMIHELRNQSFRFLFAGYEKYCCLVLLAPWKSSNLKKDVVIS